MNMEDHKVLTGGTVVTPFQVVPDAAVYIVNDRIYDVGPRRTVCAPAHATVIDVRGGTIVPGFVDLLAHGGGGFGFSDESAASVDEASRYFMKHGTTSMLAGLHAKPRERLLADCRLLARYIRENPDSNIVGIHLEGPYLNPALCGAMNPRHLWTPSHDSFQEILEAAQGAIRIMTIAPELPGALDIVREASFAGIICSIGHSTADYATLERAIENGLAHVTHIFNAMNPMHHRTPGVVTGALLHDVLKIELIADTVHVHPAMMRLLLKIKGPKGVILITDSIRAGGLHKGESSFSEQTVYSDGRRLVLKNGTLAGSVLTLNRAVRNMVQTTGTTLPDAVRMATLNPSKVLGLGSGILASGKPADLAVLDSEYRVTHTVKNGRIAFRTH
jgi:N-acetylglucosamine-6-phosphate deacetylase